MEKESKQHEHEPLVLNAEEQQFMNGVLDKVMRLQLKEKTQQHLELTSSRRHNKLFAKRMLVYRLAMLALLIGSGVVFFVNGFSIGIVLCMSVLWMCAGVIHEYVQTIEDKDDNLIKR
ncbi:hypothetical protein [Paenibacillus eucommiae]|uniref:DUF3040 domain-containing protein n=1 Tax=Paenibacillus eucommiae TaxID=1355755 RepID=A0ABS4J885_9BACL|nr:hypothetical protein [Paenibacillus eucommiae]MBP1996050.1 hypothetical protein [Paenibacillus eucommiae]